MKEHRPFERDLLAKLLETLQELPMVHAQPPNLESRRWLEEDELDAEIRLDAAGRSLTLLIEVKKSIYPRDVRQILWQISRFGALDRLNGQEDSIVPLLAAESISPGAKELLRKEKVGYFDTGGSLFIPAAGAFYYIDRPPTKTVEKSVRSLFKGKRSQVLHALLLHPREWFGVKLLAEIAKVSPATASETLKSLERFDWLITRGQGPTKERCLGEPSMLLDEWSRQVASHRQRTERRYYVPSIGSEELMEQLSWLSDSHSVECVITREAAAQRYAPFLTKISRVACRMMSGRAVERVLDELEARIVSEGANLIVIETPSPSEFLFKHRIEDVWLASPVQVYLDLMSSGGRAKEMAENLRHARIGF